MTTTTLINAQSIGTGTNHGEALFATKLALQTTTTAYVITARITNGADGYNRKPEIRIWYSTSSFSITAAVAPFQLNTTARYLDLKSAGSAAGVAIRDSSFEPVTGGFLYIWCDIPLVATAQTLDVNSQELP